MMFKSVISTVIVVLFQLLILPLLAVAGTTKCDPDMKAKLTSALNSEAQQCQDFTQQVTNLKNEFSKLSKKAQKARKSEYNNLVKKKTTACRKRSKTNSKLAKYSKSCPLTTKPNITELKLDCYDALGVITNPTCEPYPTAPEYCVDKFIMTTAQNSKVGFCKRSDIIKDGTLTGLYEYYLQNDTDLQTYLNNATKSVTIDSIGTISNGKNFLNIFTKGVSNSDFTRQISFEKTLEITKLPDGSNSQLLATNNIDKRWISGSVTFNGYKTGYAAIAAGDGKYIRRTVSTNTTDGSFILDLLDPKFYYVVPSSYGFVFNPQVAPVDTNVSNWQGIVFQGTCAPGFAPNKDKCTPLPQNGVITGNITLNGRPLNQIYLSVGYTGSYTDKNGMYQINAVFRGDNIVIPSSTQYTFSPPSLGVNVSSGRVDNINFQASCGAGYYFDQALNDCVKGAAVRNASGTVTLNGVGPFKGVSLSNGSKIAVSGSDGRFNFTGLAAAVNVIKPLAQQGYIFTPNQLSVNLTSSDQAGVNFTATCDLGYELNGSSCNLIPIRRTLSGQIRYNQFIPISDVNVTVFSPDGVAYPTTSSLTGLFGMQGLNPTNYLVKFSKPNYRFLPESTNVNLTSGNVENLNITASCADNYAFSDQEGACIPVTDKCVAAGYTTNSKGECVDSYGCIVILSDGTKQCIVQREKSDSYCIITNSYYYSSEAKFQSDKENADASGWAILFADQVSNYWQINFTQNVQLSQCE